MTPALTNEPFWAVGGVVMAPEGENSARVVGDTEARSLAVFYRTEARKVSGRRREYLADCFTALHSAMTKARQARGEPCGFAEVVKEIVMQGGFR